LHKHIKAIQEAAAFDKDKMVAPKELWFNSEALDAFFEERKPKIENQDA
jgi:hypothetical protein